MGDEADGTVGAHTGILTLFVADPARGAWREVPLRYMVRGSALVVLAPRDPLPSWAGALLGGTEARWQIGDRQFSGHAAKVAEGSAFMLESVAELTQVHGVRQVRSWYGATPIAFVLRPADARGRSPADAIEEHFDLVAPEYDRLVQANPMDAALRSASVDALLRAYRPGDRVLEIGCGTGLETLALARAGIDLVALDLSQEMLDRLQEKARREGLLSRITVRKLRASGVGLLVPEFGRASFQGAFSDFGALNLEPALDGIPRALAELVAPRGALVFGIWNRICLSEMTLYALALRPRRALARLASPVPVGLSRFGLPIYPQTPGAFLAAFRPDFRLERLEALPFLVPPYDFLPHVPRPDRILPILESADRRLRARFPFNRLGDHFMATLRRT